MSTRIKGTIVDKHVAMTMSISDLNSIIELISEWNFMDSEGDHLNEVEQELLEALEVVRGG